MSRRINTYEVAKYLIFFCVMLLFQNASTNYGIRPFGLGIMMGLIYCKQNPVLVVLFYVLSVIAIEPTIMSIVIGFVPAIFSLAMVMIFKRMNRIINIPTAIGVTLISALPIFIFYNNGMSEILQGIVYVVVATLFSYTSIITGYAIIVRGLKYRLSIDELVSASVLLMALALGMFQLNIYDFNFFFVLAGFIIMLTTFAFNGGVSVIIGAILGLGVTIGTGDLSVVSAMVLWGIVASVFRGTSKYLSGIGIVLIEVVLGYYFVVYNNYSPLNILAVGLGVGMYLVLPKKVLYIIESKFAGIKDKYAIRTLVNRNRVDVSRKLNYIGEVFNDMKELLVDDAQTAPSFEYSVEKLAQDVACNFCGKCANIKKCKDILGGDTAEILTDLVGATIKKGKVSIVDIPTFITSKCRNINGMIAAVNEVTTKYKNYLTISQNNANNKLLLADQMQGMSSLMEKLSEDIKKAISFDTDAERIIIDELAHHNIICSEAIVYGTKTKGLSISLVLRQEDVAKKILPRILSKIVGISLVVSGNRAIVSNGICNVEFIPSPCYDIVFGEATAKKREDEVSGDNKSVVRLSNDKIMVAISDGMGSGGIAQQRSSVALSMIESFYRAGFDNDIILSLVNKLLTLNNDDHFTTLDMCVIDLMTGATDFIKLGAVTGIIRHEEGYELIGSEALPIGILDEIHPTIEKKILVNGDIVVLCSDGVTDVISEEDILQEIESLHTTNPQSIADKILELAKNKHAKDDTTVLVYRLYNKIN